MAERAGSHVYSIAAHRGFADALVAGLVPRYSQAEAGLARLTLLLPSTRAIRTVSEAFIRQSGEQAQTGLLMPRMAVVGDLDLDETLGPLLDPLGGADIPPAVDPTRRWLRLAQIIGNEKPEVKGAALLRLARQQASAMDRLLVEDIGPEELLGDAVLDIVGDLAEHWRRSLHLFARVQTRWLAELQQRGELDSSARRNRLFEHAARRWKASPPDTPIVAAGVTSAAPALARMLRTIADLPNGAVILPDLDLSMDAATWDELGSAGKRSESGDPPFAAQDAITHPQYHLKLLLNRMGIARGEVQPWHRAGLAKGPPERSHAISSLFLPPEASKAWIGLAPEKRRLSGVRIMELPNPEREAQAVALLAREALEQPQTRVAIVTPDRGLAARIVAHLARWNIAADDSAGRALAQTAAARVLLLLAEIIGDEAAPVPLMALLEHPLVCAGDGRAAWLEAARGLELELRGPRPAPGMEPIRALLAQKRPALCGWWEEVTAILAPLLEVATRDTIGLSDALELLVAAGEALCGVELWGRADGRALSALVEDLRLNAAEIGTSLAPDELPAALRDAMDQVSVRPPYGGHPRLAIYGLLESRMSRAELVICAGLNEGSWPATPSQDPLLPPPVLRALGVPGGDFRIGLSAHDLAGALGAPEVVLSRSARDADGPAIPSRFLLRVQALLGEDLLKHHRQDDATAWGEAIDMAERLPPYSRPAPMPSAEQRKVSISVTGLDRLRGDPYQFYANSILRLRVLDALDAQPSAAWQGERAHEILEQWHKARQADPTAGLVPVAALVLDAHNTHPLLRALWWPRLLAGLQWIEQQVDSDPGRKPIAFEKRGCIERRGVAIRGRADRIDRLANGELAIVDYKTGSPPSSAMVEQGFALQLGLIGLMAAQGGIDGVTGSPAVFEYWSLKKDPKGEGNAFGFIETPIKSGKKRTGVEEGTFLELTEGFLDDALGRWILGAEPFTARRNPNLATYDDYDQLMRLDEWQARHEDAEDGA